MMKQSSMMYALAVAVALLGDVALAEEIDDCCPDKDFCCGYVCQPLSLQPVISCLAVVGGCCAPPPSPPDCCPKGTFCCDNTCINDSEAPFTTCPVASDCSATCDTSDPCDEEPKVVGPCEAAIPSWSFVEESGKCEFFSYGGCEGTANRFDSEEECTDTCAPELCICTKEYAPVCDPATGTTYGNSCEAACDGLTPEDFVDGVCEGCICPAVVDPVCSLDTSTTYNNECEAGCAGDNSNLSPGECGSDDCICPAALDPVCSLDTGTTYSNDCEAGCAGDDGNLKEGECE